MRPDSIPPARCGGSRAMHVSFGQYYSGIQPMDVDNVVQQNLKAASVKRFEDMVVRVGHRSRWWLIQLDGGLVRDYVGIRWAYLPKIWNYSSKFIESIWCGFPSGCVMWNPEIFKWKLKKWLHSCGIILPILSLNNPVEDLKESYW